MTAASAATPRSVFGSATTEWPAAWRRWITPVQLEASAQAPWTRTIVGVADIRHHPFVWICHGTSIPGSR